MLVLRTKEAIDLTGEEGEGVIGGGELGKDYQGARTSGGERERGSRGGHDGQGQAMEARQASRRGAGMWRRRRGLERRPQLMLVQRDTEAATFFSTILLELGLAYVALLL